MSESIIIKPGSVIGIVGGGQLGRMIAIDAAKLGYKTHIFTDVSDSPASHVATQTTVADFSDINSVDKFANSVDVVTIEFENIPHSLMLSLSKNVPVYPGWEILYTAQNRIREKELAKRLLIPVPKFFHVQNETELIRSVRELNFKALIKTVELGYDGKGQYLIKSENDLSKIKIDWNLKNVPGYVVEEFVDLEKEVSLIIARNALGDIEFFPISENHHVDGILNSSSVPALIDIDLSNRIHDFVKKIAIDLNLLGILAVEFFITKNGDLLFNEMAPRPHNSGHWSLDACNVSQFEQLVRSICGLPIQEVKLLNKCKMINILGDDIGKYIQLLKGPENSVTLYGKTVVSDRRKMGHINIID